MNRKECIILKRLIGLLLALALLCPCLALAEAAGPRTEASRQVAAYLDGAGVQYQLDTSTEYDVFLRGFSPARAEGVESIIVGALVSDERVTLETGTLVAADMSDMAALYQALNAINADAAFVRFVLDTGDGGIVARMELPIVGDDDLGYVVERCMLAAAKAVDDSYNALAALA